ncbi:hypothetical protein D8674_016332 [Pyrus ussuriensis x Pyrus communis]|uniref:Uncharacterized protein n=1 Tax=Pyrus ussuriensis x Pyrus communis TaxID=2448454 RepID=A0A5N5HF12_9ROSA|nr:hypothetical protein D8674_016332 [Pyrus ussuriensis x Pyrus communis]
MISTGRFPPPCTSKSLLAAALSFPPHKSQLGFVFPHPSSSTASLHTAIFKTGFFRQTHHSHIGFLAVHARRSSGSGVSGLVSINRVHFKTENDATSFVEMFSSQSVTFGKIQKQIKCELRYATCSPTNCFWIGRDHKADFDSDNCSMDTSEGTILDEYEGSDVEIDGPELEDAIKQSSDNDNARQLTVSELEEDQKADSDLDDSSLDTWEESIVDEYDGSDFELDEPELEDSIENLESISGSDLDGRDRDSMESWTESESLSADSSSSNQLLVKAKEEKLPRQKPVVKGKVESSPKNKKKKKLNVKQKAVKVPKLTVGGSAKRLKVKEKAVLGDVFAKYGSKEAVLASKGDS